MAIKKNKTAGTFVFVVFLIVGILIVTGGAIWLTISQKNKQYYLQAEAYIEEAVNREQGSYTVFVFTTEAGERKTVTYNGYFFLWHAGGTATIYYNPDNPAQIDTSVDLFMSVLLLVFGGIFACVGGVSLGKAVYRNIRGKEIVQNGVRVLATVTHSEWDYSLLVNDRPVNILLHSEYTDERGTMRQFVSDPYKPKRPIAVGDKVAVYISRKDEAQYYVDVNDVVSAGAANTESAMPDSGTVGSFGKQNTASGTKQDGTDPSMDIPLRPVK